MASTLDGRETTMKQLIEETLKIKREQLDSAWKNGDFANCLQLQGAINVLDVLSLQAQAIKLTWREIFDAYKAYGKSSTIDRFVRDVLSGTEYRYFNWNGRIYEVDDDYKGWQDTGIKAEDVP